MLPNEIFRLRQGIAIERLSSRHISSLSTPSSGTMPETFSTELSSVSFRQAVMAEWVATFMVSRAARGRARV